jgi:sulfide:quinone oxidoreductase
VDTAFHPDQDQLRVLIAGGGVAALEALLALRHLAEERVSVELLAAEPQFWYRPLAVAEPFGLGDVHGLDLSTVADEVGAAFILGELESVDPASSVARTRAGGELEYDVLLVTTGARPVEAIRGALTFRGPADTAAFTALVDELERGAIGRLAFAAPGTVSWPLPLYELALQTAARVPSAAITLVTHEERPLTLFGRAASAAIDSLLRQRGIEVVTDAYAVAFSGGLLRLRPAGAIEADAAVALPRLEGPSLPGLPHDGNGFIPTDATGRVRGISGVFAAGDVTSFPVKQGGLATQQADAAAEAIAAIAGAEISPEPFRPILRGLVLTGDAPLFARAELTSAAEPFSSSTDALWWPPGKIVGRYLAPYLAERSGAILTAPATEAVEVDVTLPAA